MKTSTLLVMIFNHSVALCNHWSDKSSFFFIASMKITDPLPRSTLLNISQCLDLFFRLVFSSQAKHFSSIIIFSTYGAFLYLEVLLGVTLLWFVLKFLLFLLFVVLIFCWTLCYFRNRSGTGGNNWQFQFTIIQLILYCICQQLILYCICQQLILYCICRQLILYCICQQLILYWICQEWDENFEN